MNVKEIEQKGNVLMPDSKTYPKGSTWDSTDPDNPQPLIYPICSECKEAYVYQRCFSFTSGYVWAWIKPEKVPKGCRHKAPAEIHEPERGGRASEVSE